MVVIVLAISPVSTSLVPSFIDQSLFQNSVIAILYAFPHCLRSCWILTFSAKGTLSTSVLTIDNYEKTGPTREEDFFVDTTRSARQVSKMAELYTPFELSQMYHTVHAIWTEITRKDERDAESTVAIVDQREQVTKEQHSEPFL